MVELEAVRFNCVSGAAKVVTVTLSQSVYTEGVLLGETWIHLANGVTGAESFCLRGKHPADLERMKAEGWWACAGTPGRWNGLYVNGLQLIKALEKLNAVSV